MKTIEHVRTGRFPTALVKELGAIADGDEFGARCEVFGVFTNFDTLEVDLFNDGKFAEHIIETLREHKFSIEKQGWIDEREADPESLDVEKYLALIEVIGKGRFAQRLASRIIGTEPPAYIKAAIEFVVSRERTANGGDCAEMVLGQLAGQGEGNNGINLSTLHSSKGREFSVVVMFGMDDGRIPRPNVGPRERVEARRLFYVGFTRAKSELHMMYSAHRPSPFVAEVQIRLDDRP